MFSGGITVAPLGAPVVPPGTSPALPAAKLSALLLVGTQPVQADVAQRTAASSEFSLRHAGRGGAGAIAPSKAPTWIWLKSSPTRS